MGEDAGARRTRRRKIRLWRGDVSWALVLQALTARRPRQAFLLLLSRMLLWLILRSHVFIDHAVDQATAILVGDVVVALLVLLLSGWRGIRRMGGMAPRGAVVSSGSPVATVALGCDCSAAA